MDESDEIQAWPAEDGPEVAWEDAPTRRLLLGRVVKLGLTNGFGFVRAAGGLMAYFDRADAPDFDHLRVGSRVRFQLDPGHSEHALEIRLAS